ncbi:hypothetical protein J2W51_002302 [Tardiphaga robiniae]|uniref:hypothetical protein n=1 Tax=Tardiphaga robiniae TaxID=943830 RepID=UPI00285FF3E7|nr:hypothetical protein [Tardiphaga robiniae]MDR6659732.1 hypothetical protein [Tardiphaga robiniae]
MDTTHHRPEMAQDAFSLDAFFNASQGSLRQAVEAQIDRLIAFLDYIDHDQDFEPSLGFCEPTLTGDEMPGFGWPYASGDAAQHRQHGANDDREFACEDEGGQCDDEGVEA